MEKNINQNEKDQAERQATFFKLEHFPKEFKKDWLRSFDVRFLIILTMTFIVMCGLISYTSSHYFIQKRLANAANLHENYARLLIKNQNISSFDNFNQKANETYLYGVDKETSMIAFNVAAQKIEPSTPSNLSGENLNKSNIGSIGDKATRYSNSNIGNDNSATEASSAGIFQFIATNSRLTENPTDEILQFENTVSFAGVDNIKSIHRGATSHFNSIKKQEDNTNIRGVKLEEIAFVDIVAAISPKEEAVTNVTVKNVDWAEIPTTHLTKVNKKKKENGAARSSEDISQVIMSHNLAIQDCYKQALKKNSALKGKIIVRFSVTPTGNVDQVKISQSTINDDMMERCILNKIKRWNDFGYGDPEAGDVYYRQTYVFGY